MKPGSKTRTRQTLGGGTKTVTKSKSATGAKTRTVERSKGNYQTGMEISRKVRRADKSGVSKMKSKTISRSNVEGYGSLKRKGDESNSYQPSASAAVAKTSTQVLKNTFRKRGSLRKENRDLAYSNQRQNVGATVFTSGGKHQRGSYYKEEGKGNWVKDVSRSVKESPSQVKTKMKTEDKTSRVDNVKGRIESSKRGLNRSAKSRAKMHFEAMKQGIKNLKGMTPKEALHMKGAQHAMRHTPHGPTNKQIEETSRPKRQINLSNAVETGKTYTPKKR